MAAPAAFAGSGPAGGGLDDPVHAHRVGVGDLDQRVAVEGGQTVVELGGGRVEVGVAGGGESP